MEGREEEDGGCVGAYGVGLVWGCVSGREMAWGEVMEMGGADLLGGR